jgi:hydroxymethylbilane synthase
VTLRIGTRRSALARAQADLAARMLGGGKIVPIAVSGDRGADTGDKGRFVRELEAALLDGQIDVAVHSAKDLPGDLPEGLEIAGVPAREDPRDALIGAPSLQELPAGARIGTASLRRRAQILALRPEMVVVELRGNVDTRLRKLDGGEADAIVLALAGLRRLDLTAARSPVPLEGLVPAPGQGTLAFEIRADDTAARKAVEAITDPVAARCLEAERALVRALDASCHTPVGAHARMEGDRLTLEAFAGLPDGSAWVKDQLEGAAADPAALGRAVGERMLAAGAGDILRQAEAVAQ